MKKQLENGLTVLVRENHAAPLVTADLWIRCGSADEPLRLAGVSHFLEHMIFKGSERFRVGEFDRRVENMGGILNAATSQDYTHYYVNVPSRFFPEALADLADVVTHATLDPVEFEKERNVILEEIRRKQDNPMGYLYERVFEETFREGVYKRPVLGYPETVGILTRDQMQEYHGAHYRPEAMTMVVVGDVATSAVIAEVEGQLAAYDPPPRSSPPVAPEASDNEYQWGVRRVYPRDVREAYLMMVFPSAGLGRGAEDPDIFGLEMASHILGGGRASRLWRAIREEQRLVSSISVHDFSLRRKSLLVVAATLEPDNIQPAIEAIRQEIDAFTRKGPTPDEMERARKSITNQYLFQTETNAGQGTTLGYFQTLTGDAEFADRFLKAIAEIRPGEVRHSARRYLDNERSNVLLVVPESAGIDPASIP